MPCLSGPASRSVGPPFWALLPVFVFSWKQHWIVGLLGFPPLDRMCRNHSVSAFLFMFKIITSSTEIAIGSQRREIRGRGAHCGACLTSQHVQRLRQEECGESEASLDSVGIKVHPGLHVGTLVQKRKRK